jgi:hypothetical protein
VITGIGMPWATPHGRTGNDSDPWPHRDA